MPKFEWSGDRFTMRAITPTAAAGSDHANPVTLIENMTLEGHGLLRRRQGLGPLSQSLTAPSGAVCNHVVAALNGVPTLVLKIGENFYYKTRHSDQFAALSTAGIGTAVRGSRGTFAVYGGDLYYCDGQIMWRWDNGATSTALVRPGMPEYEVSGYGAWNYDPGENPLDDPKWYRNLQVGHGGKVGTFAVSWSWYDPLRGIYGRRSQPKMAALAMTMQTDEKTEPVKFFGVRVDVAADLSGVTVPSYYQIAVWVSQSIVVRNTVTSTTILAGDTSGTFFKFTPDYFLGEYINDTHFLETVVPQGTAKVDLVKDNTTLAADGTALDSFERPHPSRFMAVLQDGTALYFFPSRSILGGPPYRNVVEYSVGHPEQIGRDVTNEPYRHRRWDQGQPTEFPLNNLAGNPIVFHPPFLVTDQAVYTLGFGNGQMALDQNPGAPGVRGVHTIAETPLGLAYLADTGHILIAGREARRVDQLLGYDRMIDLLPTGARKRCASGTLGHKIMLWMPTVKPIEEDAILPNAPINAAMVYDSARRSLSRFTIPATRSVLYAFEATLEDGTCMVVIDDAGNVYNFGTGGTLDGTTGFASGIELWLTEPRDANKRIRSVHVTYGAVDGSDSVGQSVGAAVRVRTYEHWMDTSAGYDARLVDTTTEPPGQLSHRRVSYPQFAGMEGRFVRINIGTDTDWEQGEFEIQRVEIEYDHDGDAQGHHGRA